MDDGYERHRRDVREYEYKYLIRVLAYLENLYKRENLFSLTPYEHPIEGHKVALHNNKTGEVVDVENVVSVVVDFVENFVIINHNNGQLMFENIIEDPTVIKI